jgi:6,7-dimethyl-8-ribityllumazine synthase
VKRDDARETTPPDCSKSHFAIVCARFHADIADLLADGARRALHDCGVAEPNLGYFEVPGCFELPLACRHLIETDRYDALVALGVVIRGETPHFDYVAGESARGIMDVQLATGVPIGFGVLTTDTLAQAQHRADRAGGDKGYAAAIAAAGMVQELTKLGRI